MGRVLMSIVEDTCGKHDTFCGASNEKNEYARYGMAEFRPYPNARDDFFWRWRNTGWSQRRHAEYQICSNMFESSQMERRRLFRTVPRRRFRELRANEHPGGGGEYAARSDARPKYICTPCD